MCTARLIRSRSIVLLCMILLLAAACSREPVWSTDEQANSKHFFLSLDASDKAARLAHDGNPDTAQFGVHEINNYQKIALREARLVKDSVLDKAHPELKQHFRSEYEQGLELILKSYRGASSSLSGSPSGSQISLQTSGVKLLRRWADWFDQHHGALMFPKQSPGGSD